MPALSNEKHERFVNLLANGQISAAQAYLSAGYKAKNERAAAACASRLLAIANIVARLAELKPAADSAVQQAVAARVAYDIQTRAGRVLALAERRDALYQVLAERAACEDHQTVPGGKTGHVVTKLRQIGQGGPIVTEHAVDIALLKELRETEKQIAQELGQWIEKTDETHRWRELKDVPTELLKQWLVQISGPKEPAATQVTH